MAASLASFFLAFDLFPSGREAKTAGTPIGRRWRHRSTACRPVRPIHHPAAGSQPSGGTGPRFFRRRRRRLRANIPSLPDPPRTKKNKQTAAATLHPTAVFGSAAQRKIIGPSAMPVRRFYQRQTTIMGRFSAFPKVGNGAPTQDGVSQKTSPAQTAISRVKLVFRPVFSRKPPKKTRPPIHPR